MKIIEENGVVNGWCDYNGRGMQNVITLHVDFGELKVGSSMCLPVNHTEAKLVLACMVETFIKAEALTS